MSVTVKFEAASSKDLYVQIVKFIEAGATSTGGVAAPKSIAPAASVASEALSSAPLALVPKEEPLALEPLDSSQKPPTPAVLALLKDVGIPKDEWSLVPRSGKGGRMTQADVNKYASGQAATVTPVEQAVAAVDQDEGVNRYASGQAATVTPVEQTVAAVDQVAPLDVDSANADVVSDPHATGADVGATPKTLEDVEAAIRELYSHDNGGRDACFAVLTRYGVERVREISADNIGGLYALIMGIMDGTRTAD